MKRREVKNEKERNKERVGEWGMEGWRGGEEQRDRDIGWIKYLNSDNNSLWRTN